jgi:hypothetical protein
MTTETKEPVGIVGAGRMGLAMLKHLVAAGYPVIACDMSETQRNLARQSGAEIAATPAELGSLAAFVIIGVGFDEEARAVIEGEDGLLTAMQPGGVIAVCSTVSPATVRALGAKASEKGIGTLDAPICRGRWAADAGELLALLGGTDEVVERSRPIFSTFCSDIAHLGEIGHGQGRQDHEQPAALGERRRSDRGRAVGGNDRDRSHQTARGAADQLRQFCRPRRLGHDLLHLGAEGHADRRRDS